MIKSKLTIVVLLGFMTFLISCKSPTNSNMKENKSAIENDEEQIDKKDIESTTEVQTQVDSKVAGFVNNLKTGEKLSSFFNDNWILIYHEYNRCDGSTDGQHDGLKSSLIDSIITLQVKNDGNGWDCDKKEPETFDLVFDLKKKIADWDRFEIPNYENQEKNIVYVVGAGESDYIKLYFNDKNLIVKLEYRSEDPG